MDSVFRRFSRWSAAGIWHRIFAATSDDDNFEYLIVDSTIIRAHQHTSGAKRAQDQALGRSRGGLSTKIHLAVRGLGNPVAFHLTAGHRGEVPQAPALIAGLAAQVVLADRAYDACHFRELIAGMGAVAVMPNAPPRASKYAFDRQLYCEPAVEPVVDRRRRAILGRAVTPAAAHLHVYDARNHPSVVHPPGAGWFLSKCCSIVAYASSDNQNSAMPALP